MTVQESDSEPRKKPQRWEQHFHGQVNIQLDPSPSVDNSDIYEVATIPEDNEFVSETIEDANMEVDMDVDMDLDDLSSMSTSTDESDSSDSEDSDSKSSYRDTKPLMLRGCTPEPEEIPQPSPIIPDPGLEPLPPDATDNATTPLIIRRLHFTPTPSPLSPHRVIPTNEGSGSPKSPLRHLYPHRGHSWHALQHLRGFWRNRYDEWIDYTASINNGYGSAQGPTLRGLVGPGCGLRVNRTVSPTPPPVTIHPRTGDIAGLRDVFCTHADMCMARIPMWTMAKMLWMFALHAAVVQRQEMARLRLSGVDDASDAMLVDLKDETVVGKLKARDEGINMTCNPALQPAWATTANARWNLLFQFAQHENYPPPLRTRRFFLGDEDEDEDDWVQEQCIEVDDEDEYGVLVTSTRFQRQRMICV